MSEGLKYDAGKPPLELIDPMSMMELAQVLDFGMKKYAKDNWKKLDNFEDRYYAAAMRHLLLWKSGEKTDPETGLSHLAHAFCNLHFLMWKDRNAIS